LEDDKVYIIGGIVDRNRLKRAAISRAEELGIATAKLPITDYLSMATTKVLTCNHVFEILLKYRERGNDWKKAFLDVLPVRKDAKEKE
jgi:tRNA (guanine9-N1)-methyltransferase